MSKKFKSAASSSRVQAATSIGGFGTSSINASFGSSFGAIPTSQLSYVYEPPDLTLISEPAVVVSFKNLQKKDGTTKAKALDELLTYLANISGEKAIIEEGLIEAWTRLYARTSIDNARQVRQRAHTLQGRLTSLCGKRIVKSLPSLVGPWLCGLQDNDKLVVRTTLESFAEAFPTEEKRAALWRVYQKPILAYCSTIILSEDVKTLSDERTTSQDDAEAKYRRTVGCAVQVIVQALETLPNEEIHKEDVDYSSVIRASRLWNLAASDDPFLRKSVAEILRTSLRKLGKSFDDSTLKHISAAFIGKALRTDQTGSSVSFLEALVSLTQAHPDIWTTHFASKKHSSSQNLEYFLKHIPVGGTADFWSKLDKLFSLVPTEVLNLNNHTRETSDPQPYDRCFLPRALHQGMNRRENFRSGQGIAWTSYLLLVQRVSRDVSNKATAEDIVANSLWPLVQQFVLPDKDRISWSIVGSDTSQVAVKALSMSSSLALEWTSSHTLEISKTLVKLIQTSLPEKAKNFRDSQSKVQSALERWFDLKLQIATKDETEEKFKQVLTKTVEDEATACMDTLSSRQGKPYGAMQGISETLKYLQRVGNPPFYHQLTHFLKEEGPKLIGSPCTDDLLGALHAADSIDPQAKLLEKCLSSILVQVDSPERDSALVHILRSPWPSADNLSNSLVSEVKRYLQQVKSGNSPALTQLNAVLANTTAPRSLTNEVLEYLADLLGVEARVALAVQCLSDGADKNELAFEDFVRSGKRPSLAPKLLLLSQTGKDPEIRQKATRLSSKVQMLSVVDGDASVYLDTLILSIHEGLSDTTLEAGIVFGFAQQVLRLAEDEISISQRLIPSEHAWQTILQPYLCIKPDSSLAIMNELGGALTLVDETASSKVALSYDAKGFSVVARTVRYCLDLLKQSSLASQADNTVLASLFTSLSVFGQIASDHLSVTSDIPLWKARNEETDEIVDLVSDCQSALRDHVLSNATLRDLVHSALLLQSQGSSVSAYYSARAYFTLTQELFESSPQLVSYHEDELLSILKTPSGSMHEFAMLATTPQSSGFSKLVNSLVAELTRYDFDERREQSLKLLVMLNLLIKSPFFHESTITQKHRLVLFVKRVTAAFHFDAEWACLDAEIMQTLVLFLPLVKDIFDTFWDDTIDIIDQVFAGKLENSVLIHSSLKLYAKYSILSNDGEDANEDFLESWSAKKEQLQKSLIMLMKSQAQYSDTHNQPRQIINGMINRQVSGVQESAVETSFVYPVLVSDSTALQQAAFKFLHKKIPRTQEQITMDAALVKDYKAHVSTELLDMVSRSLDDVFELTTVTVIPSQLLQFIFGWRLIFDHWVGASYQVQNDYVESVRDSNTVKSLLDTIFDYLVTGRYKPFDPSKSSFEIFDLSDAGSLEQRILGNFCHLYLLSLRHLPALVRSWFRDECPRSLQRTVGEWTEKYFSSRVVTMELSEVSKWVPKQETDTPLEVKVSPKAREITAMYPVDEQMAAIRISLPADYPLSTIAVEDLNRVGVEERKWRSWLINAQGIMNFAPSSGGLGAVTDGLVAWRRNVTGTLKGQSECAICYSIVNADRQLPTKKCGTCKNAFHGTCLFKWFKSSGGSSCPLCRNAFNYG